MEPIVDIYVPPRGWPRQVAGRHHAPEVRGVRWTDDVHGPDQAEFTVLDPATAAVLATDCPVVISDPASGEVLWTGNVASDGVQLSPLGESAVVRCEGTVAWMYRAFWSLPYVVKDSLGQWERETIKYSSHPNFDTSQGSRPHDPPKDALVFQVAERDGAYPNMVGRMAYLGHLGTHMYIGGFSGWFDAFGSPTDWRQTLYVGDSFYDNKPVRISWQTVEALHQPKAGEAGWPMPPRPKDIDPAGRTDNYLVAMASWEPPGGTAGFETTQAYWCSIHSPHVVGQRVDVWGNNVPTPRIGYVLAHEVAADLVGRCLEGVIDPARTNISPTSWAIEHMDYRDPASPGEILEDLEAIHPDHLWRVGRRSTTTELSSFEWRRWAETPRYVISTDEAEVDFDDGGQRLYNRVTVRYVDWRGRPRTKSFDADPALYPDVAAMQGVREAEPIDLHESLGRIAIVDRVGEQRLSQVARRVRAGTVTVTSPVLDVTTQLRVPPSMIEAGATVGLSSDEPMVAHRVVAVEHDGLGVATLSVGARALSLERVIAWAERSRK